jgi:hypothetical protein
MNAQIKRAALRISAVGGVFFAVVLLFCPASFSQTREIFKNDDISVTWGGHIKSLTTLTTPGGDEYWNGAVTMRLKTEANYRDKITLTLHYEVTALWGQSLSNPTYRSSSLHDPDVFANLWWGIADSDDIALSHTLDRAYLTIRTEPLTLIVGRQRIAWGVARFISPTDLFNPFDPAAIDKEEKRGTDAVTAEIPFGRFTGMTLVFAPTSDMDDASWAFRAYTNISDWDFSIMAGRFDRREVVGMDFSGQIGSIALWGECAALFEDNRTSYLVEDSTSFFGFSTRQAPREYIRAVIGGEYIFPNTFSILVEYYYNGRGECNKEDYDWQAQIEGKEVSLARDYLFVTLGYEITPLLVGSLSAFVNLDDGGVLIAPSLEYSITEDLSAVVGAQIGTGEETTEYGSRPELYYLQVRYYF